MILSSQQLASLEQAAQPLMRWIRDNCPHFHVRALVDRDCTEIFEGSARVKIIPPRPQRWVDEGRPEVTIGSQWEHTNGNRYTVVALANLHSEDPVKYSPTVVYLGANGRLWSRRLNDWSRSMSPVS